VAYSLFWEEVERIYLRHLFVRRARRSAGVGRACLAALRAEVWTPGKRIVVEVLCGNPRAIAFYHSVGFGDYSLALELPPE
jgi:GNAT superfamily N-acetyltransferase